MEEREKKSILDWITSIQSFSKWITFIWLGLWVEVILFSQFATIIQFGDTAAIATINDNVLQIGLVICGFYFSTKCVENVAKGIECYLMMKYEKTINKETTEEVVDQSDDDSNLACG